MERDHRVEEVLKQAEQHAEKGEFAIAVGLLRATALQSEPTSRLLRILDETEDLERVAFRKHLAETTDALECHVEWVRMISNKRTAHYLCCQLITRYSDDQDRQQTLRHLRFDLALDGDNFDCLHEDFVWLWNWNWGGPNDVDKVRTRLLRRLARINDPNAIPDLQRIVLDRLLSNRDVSFVDAKCKELTALDLNPA